MVLSDGQADRAGGKAAKAGQGLSEIHFILYYITHSGEFQDYIQNFLAIFANFIKKGRISFIPPQKYRNLSHKKKAPPESGA